MVVSGRGARSLSEARDVVTLAADTAAEPARAGRQLIATIGIDSYRHWRHLHNAVGDAEGVAGLFRRLGFEDVVPPLLDERATRGAIDALSHRLRRLDPSDSLVVFYAGHGGVRTERLGEHEIRTGYLIPVDADDDDDQVASWIDLDAWLRQIARLPPRHILVILDACFSGIALRSVHWGRDSGKLSGLPFAAANARRSRLLLTSARDDERAMDSGPTPGHSLFTGCLIEALTGGVPKAGVRDGRPVVSGSDVAVYVRRRVHTYDGRPGGQQTPDFGTLDYDDRGEMLIPLLVDDPPAVSARGSIDGIDEPETTDPMVAMAATTESVASALPATESVASEQAATESMASEMAPTEPMVIEPRPTGSMVFRPGPAAPPQRSRWWITASAAILAGIAVALLWYGAAAEEDPSTIVVAPAASPVGGQPAPAAAKPVTAAVESATRSPDWSPEDHAPAPEPPAPSSASAPSSPAQRATPHAAVVASPAVAPPARRICPTNVVEPKGAEVSWNGIVAAVPTQDPLPLPCGVQVELGLSQPRRRSDKKLVIPSDDRKDLRFRLKPDPDAKPARSRSR